MNDLQKKKEQVAHFRPIDDGFFEVLVKNSKVCEEILQVILEDKKLKVIDVIPQKSIKNLWGRSVRLDAHCILGDGTFANIEVQKANDDDHLRRVRYNGAAITTNITEPGEKFEKVPDVIVVYISIFDIFKRGKTIYHVCAAIEETGEFINDGFKEVFVNTNVDDGTEISELMKCFLQEKVDNPKFKELSNMVRHLKEDEEGVNSMCKIMEDYAKERVNENTKSIVKTLIESGMPCEEVSRRLKMPLKEIQNIEKEMMALV